MAEKTNKNNRAYFAQISNKGKILSISNRNFYNNVMCPRCSGNLILHGNLKENQGIYECNKCRYSMTFIEYQKRYINLNWQKTIELGFKLYSWDQNCKICGESNPCISYCINQSVGTEELCLFEPFLLGTVRELDKFIMKFCDAINLFPNSDGILIPTIFCKKCDAPFEHDFFVESFLKQKKMNLEYTIKRKILEKYLNLQVEDITSLLSKLKYLNY